MWHSYLIGCFSLLILNNLTHFSWNFNVPAAAHYTSKEACNPSTESCMPISEVVCFICWNMIQINSKRCNKQRYWKWYNYNNEEIQQFWRTCYLVKNWNFRLKNLNVNEYSQQQSHLKSHFLASSDWKQAATSSTDWNQQTWKNEANRRENREQNYWNKKSYGIKGMIPL